MKTRYSINNDKGVQQTFLVDNGNSIDSTRWTERIFTFYMGFHFFHKISFESLVKLFFVSKNVNMMNLSNAFPFPWKICQRVVISLGQPCWWYEKVVIISETNMALTLSSYSIFGSCVIKSSRKKMLYKTLHELN